MFTVEIGENSKNFKKKKKESVKISPFSECHPSPPHTHTHHALYHSLHKLNISAYFLLARVAQTT